jgi:hypothetical protein
VKYFRGLETCNLVMAAIGLRMQLVPSVSRQKPTVNLRRNCAICGSLILGAFWSNILLNSAVRLNGMIAFQMNDISYTMPLIKRSRKRNFSST